MDNYTHDIIKYYAHKRKLSHKMHNRIFKVGDDEREFLFYFDTMNVYPLFPTIISLEISDYDGPIVIAEAPIYRQTTLIDTKYRVKTNKKISECERIPDEEIAKRKRNTVRKFFSYEIIDELTSAYNAEYVTVAWLKSYEIISFYNLISPDGDTVNYFGICEQPGAFVFSLNHYIKTKTRRNFDFVLESLVDPKNSKIFKPQYDLYNQYSHKYDYAYDKTGDVTNMDNIKYYRKKYYDRHFDIITADCGLDCSDDFTLQETNLLNVIYGQFILALSLADTGTNYFFKTFTIYEYLMTDLIYFAKKNFENVYICRTLTTKPDSGETYIVCKNFIHSKSTSENIINQLIKWYASIFVSNKEVDIVNSRLLDPESIPDEYYDEINKYNKILGLRRLVSIDMTIFRFKNNSYIADSPIVKKYVKQLVDHYTKYFINLYGIRYLANNDHLVTTKITSKWTAEVKIPKIVNSKSYSEFLMYRNIAAYQQYTLFQPEKVYTHKINLDSYVDYDAIKNNVSMIPHSAYFPQLDKTMDTYHYYIKLNYQHFLLFDYFIKFFKTNIEKLHKFVEITVTNMVSRQRYPYFDAIEKIHNIKLEKKTVNERELDNIYKIINAQADTVYYIRSRSDVTYSKILDFLLTSIIFKCNFVIQLQIDTISNIVDLQKLIYRLHKNYAKIYLMSASANQGMYQIFVTCLDYSDKNNNINGSNNHDSKSYGYLDKMIKIDNGIRDKINTVSSLKALTNNSFYMNELFNERNEAYIYATKTIFDQHGVSFDYGYFD